MSLSYVNFFSEWILKSRDPEIIPDDIAGGQASPIATAQGVNQLAAENDDTQSIIDDRQMIGLLRRIYLLHWQTEDTSTPSSTAIPQAFSLWQELKDQEASDPHQYAKSDSAEWLCLSSLFIWLHLIVYPKGVESPGIQLMVTKNLPHILRMNTQNTPNVHSLLIPLFFHGIASIQEHDREAILESFLLLEPRIDFQLFHDFKSNVLKSWRRYDEGIDRSWNWIERAADDSGNPGLE
ncbi:hypothetical protein N7452_001186 [Penicillium brevicompactum]|uniref:Uncharacterized protein n=1 Tax=Penicillium brevicompactum TaxID=5074 RepID=A0A9W9UP99_PENBR|nr:hypothetical protein N7452_001186 [Penicillium brevicompactum]